MTGGAIMISDMFNSALKARVGYRSDTTSGGVSSGWPES